MVAGVRKARPVKSLTASEPLRCPDPRRGWPVAVRPGRLCSADDPPTSVLLCLDYALSSLHNGGMDMRTENFRRNVAMLSKMQGVTQSDLARDAGISRVYLNRLIHGHYEPSLRICERIAVALRVPLELLLAAPPTTTCSGGVSA